MSVLDLAPAEVAARLRGTREEVAAFVREAAVAGSAEAMARHAQMLLDGDGVAADPPAAFGWFDRAARAGHLEAANMMGRCHDLGRGTPVDKAAAAAWYRFAASRGSVHAIYNYATLLTLGEGVAQDRAAAFDLFRQAAARGFAKAWNFVGSFHEDGWATPYDMGEAARCYQRAAEGGDFRGQFNHARMLAAAGRVEEAQGWVTCALAGGTERFRDQVAQYLRDFPFPRPGAIGSHSQSQ